MTLAEFIADTLVNDLSLRARIFNKKPIEANKQTYNSINDNTAPDSYEE